MHDGVLPLALYLIITSVSGQTGMFGVCITKDSYFKQLLNDSIVNPPLCTQPFSSVTVTIVLYTVGGGGYTASYSNVWYTEFP